MCGFCIIVIAFAGCRWVFGWLCLGELAIFLFGFCVTWRGLNGLLVVNAFVG